MALTAYQAHMKRELKGKMKGKTAAQRKAIFKAAAKSYNKKGSSKPKARASRAVTRVRTSISSKPKSGGTSKMGKKNGFNTQKIFKYVRLGALALPAASIVMEATSIPVKIEKLARAYMGYNTYTKQMEWGGLIQGYGPLIGATVATVGIPKIMSIIRRF